MLRYLTGNYKYNIILPIGFLFNRSRGYSKLRKKILEEYHCFKISIASKNILKNTNISTAILTIKPRTQTKIILDSFKLLEFIKIISSDLFKSMDYDVYLTIIKYLKQVYENEVIKYSKLELNDNSVIETEEKNIYLKDQSFDKYYSIDKLIHENV